MRSRGLTTQSKMEPDEPTFNMGRDDTIADNATVLITEFDGFRHILSNRATISRKSVAAVVDEEAACVRRHFEDPGADFICTIGHGSDPLFARKWRGHYFVWSSRSNMWKLMMSHSEVKQEVKLAEESGCRVEAHSEAGQAFADSA